ncbi:MAG TPA: sugar phosphate isomerase/epimerase family protein, partial [Acetobacteraceae bacterium]|nr:sugar phosphate isomerase/epimerase family protein [Acetobacteraceae bacterium]
GLIEAAFAEQGKRWRPILDAFDREGVDLCYEIHPGEDVFDGVTFEMFREAVGNHPRCAINYDPSHFLLQGLDYLAFIDNYHEYIRAFHVKDAELRPDGRQGVYSGFQPWLSRAGRFRSLGDGQVDFSTIFSKMAQYNYDSWAVLEWECCLKDPGQGAREGAEFIRRHIIRVTERSFEDFAAGAADPAQLSRVLGLADARPLP